MIQSSNNTVRCINIHLTHGTGQVYMQPDQIKVHNQTDGSTRIKHICAAFMSILVGKDQSEHGF